MIFLDTETTGLLRPVSVDPILQPYITEIYAIRIDPTDFSIVNEIETLVKPPVPIPDEVTNITGLTDDDVRNAPTFLQIYDELCDLFLGEDTLVAHNASFDVNIIRWELVRHDLELKFPWPMNHICTVEKSYHIENHRLTLSALHKLATGKEHKDNAHRAKDDVMALIRCYLWLVDEGHI